MDEEGAGPAGIREVAEAVAGWARAEGRLFEVAGAWAPTTGHPGAKELLARASAHAGWRAQRWAELAPLLWDAPPDLGQATARSLVPAALAEGGGPAPTEALERLVVVHRVALPRLAVAYRAARARTTPVADAALARLLDQALADATADWQAGEALVQALVGGPGQAARAASAQQGAEAGLSTHP